MKVAIQLHWFPWSPRYVKRVYTNEKKTATKHQFIALLAREEKNKGVF